MRHSDRSGRRLVGSGLRASTPVWVIERGTQPEQRVRTATLDSLAHVIAREKVKTPALLIVGEVVKMYRRDSGLHSRQTSPRRGKQRERPLLTVG